MAAIVDIALPSSALKQWERFITGNSFLHQHFRCFLSLNTAPFHFPPPDTDTTNIMSPRLWLLSAIYPRPFYRLRWYLHTDTENAAHPHPAMTLLVTIRVWTAHHRFTKSLTYTVTTAQHKQIQISP